MSSLKIPCVIMRGGTSKAIFFNASDLPNNHDERDRIILKAFGSPDIRQIDGLGGANSSTSKAAIIAPRKDEDCDIDYTFAQVSIDTPVVGMGMNCGNISAAVGPYAIEEGYVIPVEPETTVRIFNTNTRKKIIAKVPVKNGHFIPEGNFKINGVPGTGAKITLTFEDPAGAISGNLLPTGRAKDIICVDGLSYEFSLVDAANPVVFLRAADFGLNGTETPSDFEKTDSSKKISRTFETIRAKCAVMLRLADTEEEATYQSPELPKICYCAPKKEYFTINGEHIKAENIDIVGRLFSMGKMINAYMGTGAICTIAAANVQNSIVREMIECGEDDYITELNIGHPLGVMPVAAQCETKNNELISVIKNATIYRTARTVMKGSVYID